MVVCETSKKTGQAIVTDRKNRLGLIKEALRLKAGFIDIDISAGEKAIREIIKIADAAGEIPGKGKRQGKSQIESQTEKQAKRETGKEAKKKTKPEAKRTKIIVSFHNFRRTSKKEVMREYSRIKRLNPDIIKIAAFANSINDNIIIFELLKRAGKENRRIIALCMGEKGEPSRILTTIFGGELTYGSAGYGKESAPGQIPAEMLKKVYRIDELIRLNKIDESKIDESSRTGESGRLNRLDANKLDANRLNKLVNRLDKPIKTRIFGLVGNPVRQSRGIFIHNNSFRRLKLNSIYLNFLVDELGPFIKSYKPIISGLSITIPFKREIIKYLDGIEPAAKKIKAVNTVIKEQGRLIGYNTDIGGAIKALEQKAEIKNKRVLMLGAGGAARAIGYGIIKKGGKLIIANRTTGKAKKLAGELRCSSIGLSQLSRLDKKEIDKEEIDKERTDKEGTDNDRVDKPAERSSVDKRDIINKKGIINKKDIINKIDIIINATSIGMFPEVNKTPIEKRVLKRLINKNAVVFDSVYNPKNTKLLKEAKQLGCSAVSGYEMFIYQGEEQLRLFIGKKIREKGEGKEK